MTYAQTAQRSYARADAPMRSTRSIEYDILARTTKALTSAARRKTEDYAGLVAALHDNQRLWSTFAADVADDDNGLPQALRARLFYLFEFTVTHSRHILDGHGSVDVLVDINTAVMRGLRGDVGGAA
jgi:flagellar biosynthesis activator protein FlaF